MLAQSGFQDYHTGESSNNASTYYFTWTNEHFPGTLLYDQMNQLHCSEEVNHYTQNNYLIWGFFLVNYFLSVVILNT